MIANLLLSHLLALCLCVLIVTCLADTSLDLKDEPKEQEYLITLPTLCPEGCTCSLNTNEETLSVSLDCNDKNLTEIPRLNKELPAYKLDVGRNEIAALKDGDFQNYTHVEIILAFINSIETVDVNAFKGLKNLREIDLSDNLLCYIHPDTFKDNVNLKTVTLFGNSLVQVSGNAPILNAPSVTDLDISFCKLTSLTSESFKNLPGLETLDISSNDLKSLSVESLKQIGGLKSVRLENNRWSCDCNLTAVLSWITKLQQQNTLAAHKPVRCIAPGGGVRKLWSTTMADILNCNSSEVEAPPTNNCTENARNKRDTIGDCSKNPPQESNSEFETTDSSVTNITTEISPTVITHLFSFLEQNCELIFAVILSISVFTLTTVFAYICVKRVMRSNLEAADENNGRNNLQVSFGEDLNNKRHSCTPLLGSSSSESRCPPSTTAPRYDHPPSLYLEYLSTSLEHVYEVVR